MLKQCIVIFFAGIFFLPAATEGQEVIQLYPGAVPNSTAAAAEKSLDDPPTGLIRHSVNPTLQLFLPPAESASGAAVIICPGGGYSVIVYEGEGINTAKEFAKKGIAAFVLKYRLPNDSFQMDKKIAPLQDAQQAIKLVRENAARWNINPGKIGIMGFSAGGPLASTEATHFKKAWIDNPLNTSLRPDFQILVYPVISMQDSLTHKDSRTKLLGPDPSKEIIGLFSNEGQVNMDSPPAYITHAADDKLVDVDNSVSYFEQLRHHGIPVEMHIYPKGGHGFVFRHEGWMDPLFKWMKDAGFTE